MNSLVTTKLRSTLLIIAAGLLWACAPPSVDPVTAESPRANKGPAQIDLPPMVRLAGSIPPETYPDNTLRVDGLLARRQKYLGQKVMVRGHLIEAYQCPKGAERCESPHIWLHASQAGGEKKLLVVGFIEETIKKLALGEQYVVTGDFTRRSPTGFTNSKGMVDLATIEGAGLKERVESQRIIAAREREEAKQKRNAK